MPDADVGQAINPGICKVNVGTELRPAYTGSISRAIKRQTIDDPRSLLDIAKEAAIEVVRGKIRLCGANRRAEAIGAQKLGENNDSRWSCESDQCSRSKGRPHAKCC